MRNAKTMQLLRFIPLFLLFSQVPANAQSEFGVWSGSISMQRKYVGQTGSSETQVMITIIDNRATGTVKGNGELIMSGMKLCSSSCSGSGPAELHNVIINLQRSYYRIEAISPKYTCNNTGLRCEGGAVSEMHALDVGTSDRPLDNNPNVLVGSETRVSDIAGMGTQTTTVTWNLVRSIDVELIVTPQNYDNWLPEPGKDELTKGSVINIDLKVRGRNGKPLSVKATKFELTLSNTSKEPGITLNMPIIPPSESFPDLRFLKHPTAESNKEDQFITIPCTDGSTGKLSIGSYDGGGWTTLTAVAILADGNQIRGSLFDAGGEKEILIPKREPGSKIAFKWLKENGSPGEMDDKDASRGNTNNGDGFTAYEEYRGVISEGKFKRLAPDKKELGIRLKTSEISLFTDGLQWFETASDIKIIRFNEMEIARNRRLNKNVLSAHDYDQYALRVEKRNLPKGVVGSAYNGPDIPAVTDPVVFDWNQIQTIYQGFVDSTKPEQLKFTVRDYLASTIAHEIAHGVNVWHHGDVLPHHPTWIVDDITNSNRIFDRHGNLITKRPVLLRGIGRTSGTVESGDLSCFTNYYPFYKWGYTVGSDGANIFNQTPLLPLGKNLCNSKNGTGTNATKLYFGDANPTKGNCLSQIKLRN